MSLESPMEFATVEFVLLNGTNLKVVLIHYIELDRSMRQIQAS